LGLYWRAFEWKMLVYFNAIWNIWQPFGKYYGHLVHFVVIWYMFSHFGILYQEKSGNRALKKTNVWSHFVTRIDAFCFFFLKIK
jgi:hypothetical protein